MRFPADEGVPTVVTPAFMEELIAELTHLARRAPEISQRSGVSVRVSVANAEVLEAAALKRAIRLGEPGGAPRVSDLGAVLASTVGKVELETVGEDVPEERIVERLITKALFATFGARMTGVDLDEIIDAFDGGLVMETGDRIPSREYVRWMREVPGLPAAVRAAGVESTKGEPASAALVASAVEFVLEGLHLQRRLNKDRAHGAVVYRR
jgi:magnesium chelatase subunit I